MYDAFFRFTGQEVKGETQDDEMSKKGAFEVLSFDFGCENSISIGSISGGGGAGKMSFKELSLTKKCDTSSTAFFEKLCLGTHFDEGHLELRRAGGTTDSVGKIFFGFKFKFMMVQDIAWSGSEGDEIFTETIILRFGACEMTYTPQLATGKDGKPCVSRFSATKNKNVYAV